MSDRENVMQNHQVVTRQPLLGVAMLTLFTLFVVLVPPTSAFATICCDHAIRLDLNSTRHSFGGEDELFALHLPTTGIVTLELIHAERPSLAPGRGPMQIAVVDGDVILVERSATQLVLAVDDAETVLLQVVSSSAYRLVTTFVAARVEEETLSAPTPAEGSFVRRRFFATVTPKGDPEEVDPDPDHPASQERDALLLDLLSPRPAVTTKGDPEEVDPDPDALGSTTPERSASAGGARSSVLFYEPFCPTAMIDQGDDHADAMSCATSIRSGATVAGRLDDLHEDGADDSDVFRIELGKLTTLDIATRGDDTFGTLYDASGQELTSDDDGADGAGFRIVRALAPGRYYVRVEAVGGAAGAYELSVTTRDR